MPPRTLSSAVALVSLASLTAVEAGGCDKRPESLRSASRAGLPLMLSAVGTVSTEAAYNLADYGVGPVPGLRHLCGHFELSSEGDLITKDLFVAEMPAERLSQLVGVQNTAQSSPKRGRQVSLRVSPFTLEQLPSLCQKLEARKAHSLLVASRAL